MAVKKTFKGTKIRKPVAYNDSIVLCGRCGYNIKSREDPKLCWCDQEDSKRIAMKIVKNDD